MFEYTEKEEHSVYWKQNDHIPLEIGLSRRQAWMMTGAQEENTAEGTTWLHVKKQESRSSKELILQN